MSDRSQGRRSHRTTTLPLVVDKLRNWRYAQARFTRGVFSCNLNFKLTLSNTLGRSRLRFFLDGSVRRCAANVTVSAYAGLDMRGPSVFVSVSTQADGSDHTRSVHILRAFVSRDLWHGKWPYTIQSVGRWNPGFGLPVKLVLCLHRAHRGTILPFCLDAQRSTLLIWI